MRQTAFRILAGICVVTAGGSWYACSGAPQRSAAGVDLSDGSVEFRMNGVHRTIRVSSYRAPDPNATADINISGTDKATTGRTTMVLNFHVPNKAGSYPLKDIGMVVFGTQEESGRVTGQWGGVGGQGSGTVTVQSVTATHVRGTFSFTLPPVDGRNVPAMVLDRGTFDTDYIVITPAAR